MDTSAGYVEMCRKATEIQEEWKPQQGQMVAATKDVPKFAWWGSILKGSVHLLERDTEYGLALDDREDIEQVGAVWLPRQDELQAMVRDKYPTATDLWEEFTGKGVWWSNKPYSGSLEQMWLELVMRDNYGKTWDGKEWVKA